MSEVAGNALRDVTEDSCPAGIQVGIDTGLWEAWTAAGGGVKSLDELCKLAKVDIEPNLLRRFLRHLAAFNVVEEKGVDQWAPTTFSTALGTPSSSIGLLFQGATDHSLRQNAHMPIFLKKTGYKEPLDNTKDSYSVRYPIVLPSSFADVGVFAGLE